MRWIWFDDLMEKQGRFQSFDAEHELEAFWGAFIGHGIGADLFFSILFLHFIQFQLPGHWVASLLLSTEFWDLPFDSQILYRAANASCFPH